MSLITCKDCKKEFSTDAKRCPNCGAKPPVKRGGCFVPLLLLVFGIPVLGIILGIKPDNPKDNEKKNPQDYVLGHCREFIKDSLHDPSSMEFDPVFPNPSSLPDHKYSMTLSLRAKNGFGALRHFAIDCTVRFNGNSWSLVKLNEIH